MNGKQILSESCKQAVRRTATPTMPNKWAAPRAGRGPGMRTRGQAQKERGPALGAGPLLRRKRPQSASGVLVSHGLDPQYNRRSGA